MKEFKICLLGSGSVGKSALAIQFTEDRFVEHYDPTVEDCYRKTYEYNGDSLVLEIIDTAGTEQFTSMVELYVRNCVGFILVYDIGKKSTFDDLEPTKKMVWDVKKASKKKPVPMILIGNKSDQEDREVLLGAGSARAVEWGAAFIETSAKNKTNVEEAFQGLLARLLPAKKSGGCTIL